ncbi:putative ABC-type transport system periplasmic component/surface lipoprotein [Gaiella occulta]|uniref:Putative ABC-type transport system periplasmic component/surface lipoprotein n=1 Tax=Gaiella occulta TaxID=1002870 RepID=A0A7M2Z022_9ACTN|nr:BMP family ABC transporter substrate-binding protein [Gaiella occulta]RDI75123.1 putative ABC-type transport system periplasmic component/surface lipoprotein [Gaiella occulta]
MAIRKRTVGVALALVAVLALSLASIGSASSAKSEATIKVALITDIGGLNDKGFNALANVGLQTAKKKLKVQGRVFISKSAADYVPNLSAAARGNYDLVIAVGFLMSDSLSAVAKKFPKTKFAIVDVSAPFMKGKPKNVRGIVFAEQEAGYLAGVAAATVSKTGTVSTIGGIKIPPVDAFIAGFQAGAKATKPGITLLNDYSQDFVDQAKCKELALNQIAQGSDVVFQVAGGCGLGALSAAQEKGVWGIGVDNDQSFLGKHVLTSAQKKVDQGVFQTIQLVTTGKFKGGVDGLFSVKNDGVGFGKVSPAAPPTLAAKLASVSAAIKAGKISKIPRLVK